MMAKRFIVEKQDIKIDGENIEITGSEVRHINVLRKNVGDNILVNEYVVEITKLEKDKIYGTVIDRAEDNGVPSVNITLIQSYLKSDKMDYVVQKAVELGVKTIIPVLSKNTVVKLDEKDSAKKVERLNKIAKEAIGQCGRTDAVIVESVSKLKDVDFSKYDLVIICHEKGKQYLTDILEDIYASLNVAVVIGPEGGLDEEEIANIECENKKIIVFGERVLRAETASLYILSVFDYLLQ